MIQPSVSLYRFIWNSMIQITEVRPRKRPGASATNILSPCSAAGNYRILKTSQLVTFKNVIVRDKSPNIAYDTMRTLRKILNRAVEWDFLAVNPLKTRLPGEPKSEHPILDPARLFEMIDQLDGQDKCIIATAGYVGLRRSEIAGLKWSDFNFKVLTLNLQRQYSAGQVVIFRDKKVLKTESSRSRIPLWSRYVMLMKRWKLQCGSPEWVFKGRKGKLLFPLR